MAGRVAGRVVVALVVAGGRLRLCRRMNLLEATAYRHRKHFPRGCREPLAPDRRPDYPNIHKRTTNIEHAIKKDGYVNARGYVHYFLDDSAMNMEGNNWNS